MCIRDRVSRYSPTASTSSSIEGRPNSGFVRERDRSRTSIDELVEAVGEYLETKVMASSEGAARFEARVALNVLAMVQREMALGSAALTAHTERLLTLGVPDEASMASVIRAGRYDDDLPDIGGTLAEGVRDKLLVVNPSYLEDPANATD